MSLVCIVRTCIGIVNAPAMLQCSLLLLFLLVLYSPFGSSLIQTFYMHEHGLSYGAGPWPLLRFGVRRSSLEGKVKMNCGHQGE